MILLLLVTPLVLYATFIGYCMLRDFGWNRYKHNVFTNPQYLNPDADVNGESEVFSTKSIAKEYDAIVIGSGISGLSSAAILSKAGKRVLVLEQHDTIGGAMHTFEQDGIPFDTGVHFIGYLKKGTLHGDIINYVSDSVVEWNHIADVTDQIFLGSSNNHIKYDIRGGSVDEFIQCLTKYFPDESSAILKYVHLVQGIGNTASTLFISKLLPVELLPIFKLIGLKWNYYARSSLKTLLDSLTNNVALKTVLAHMWGTHGSKPSEASALDHGRAHEHYLNSGSFYPVGGTEPMINSLVKVIKKSNGMVYLRASVKNILVSKNKVVGVRMDRNDFVIYAPLVISSAGVYNTLIHLLPKTIVQKYDFESKVNAFESCNAGNLACLTFNGSCEELGLTQSNYWIYPTADANNIQAYDCEKDLDKFRASNGVMDPKNGVDIPYIYITCQSAKDPILAKQHPNKTAISVMFPCCREWFDEWKDSTFNRRSSEYNQTKNALLERTIEIVTEYFPKCAGKLSTASLGTSLTNNYFLRYRDGGMYGSFSSLYTRPDMSWIRPKTPIEGLYMTGQDVCFTGWYASLHSSLVTCSQILHRVLYSDFNSARDRKVEQKK
jgi:all-trans-retinol 13,14-reductase